MLILELVYLSSEVGHESRKNHRYHDRDHPQLPVLWAVLVLAVARMIGRRPNPIVNLCSHLTGYSLVGVSLKLI